MKRGIIFTIHSTAGLLSGLFILIMSFSGAVLVFHEAIDKASYPSGSTVERAYSKIIPIDKAYNNVQKKFPHAQIDHCLLATDNKFPFTFFIYDSSYQNGKEALNVYVQPQSGEVIKGRGSKTTTSSKLGRLHSTLLLGKKGEWLLGFFSLVFLLSIVTGLILFRKNVGAVLTFRKRVFKYGNLHQLVGVYALLFNLVLGFSGFWMQRYVFKKEFYKNYSYAPVLKPSPVLFYSLDNAFQNLKEKYPDFTGYVIYFAQSKKGKTAIYGSRKSNSFIHSKKFADMIALDSSGAVAQTRFVTEISSSDRYDIINAQVHFGQYGGWVVKILYFVFGMTSGLLSMTGFLLWLKRRRSNPG